MRGQMNPDWFLEEPEPTDYDELDTEQNTRSADDADEWRKEKQC